MRRMITMFLMLFVAVGGCAVDTDASPDGEFDDAIAAGKADGSDYSGCELGEEVAMLNQATTSTDGWREQGIHSRAARNLMTRRNGVDGEFGTGDDDLFDDIQEVDAVSWVGPVAMSQLVAAISDRCTAADNGGGSCQEDRILGWLNDSSTDTEALRGFGVSSRAANNLIEARPFSSLEEVDAVPYVGPVTMQRLHSAVSGQCGGPTGDAPSVVFSPQPVDQSHLARVIRLLDSAENSIDIAMYSFRYAPIQTALERAIDRGVSVRMVFESARSHASNPDGTSSAGLEAIGVDVRYINVIMHHKFAIVDGPRESLDQALTTRIVSGSGNWSSGAGTVYDENTVFFDNNPELALRFQQEFNHMWTNSRDLVANEGLEYFESIEITDADLETFDDPGLDVLFTSDNFRTYVNSRWGNTFSTNFDGLGTRGVVELALLDAIANAEDEILIASGHFKNRWLADALAAKRAADPDIEIRIYLDGQEYVRPENSADDIAARNECATRAMNEGRNERWEWECGLKRVHYSYFMDEAGIDVRLKYYSYSWHYSLPQMHHKYLIIDGDLYTGSYNISFNAEFETLENVMVFDGDAYGDLVETYRQNFNRIFETGRADAHPELLSQVNGDGDFPLVFDAMALTNEEIRSLKSAIYRSCNRSTLEAHRSDPVRNRMCYR
ncbi:MAG: phospholipase D-like domain-containing protein [Myxococcota bacterium]